jgi:hypothetical protein
MIQDTALSLGLINMTSDLTAVIGNTDPTVNQLLALANKEGKDLSQRYDWQSAVKEATFTTTATELQGTLVSIAGSGFKSIISNTMWDRTFSRPIRGSISNQRWARLKGSTAAGTFSEHQIRDDSIYAIPAPATASSLWAFFYRSKYWCQSSSGTGQDKWAADDDTGILNEDLMSLGIEWRYLKAKGFDYSEEFQTYERRLQEAILQDRDHPTINLETSRIGGPGVLGLPEGSWPSA